MERADRAVGLDVKALLWVEDLEGVLGYAADVIPVVLAIVVIVSYPRARVGDDVGLPM